MASAKCYAEFNRKVTSFRNTQISNALLATFSKIVPQLSKQPQKVGNDFPWAGSTVVIFWGGRKTNCGVWSHPLGRMKGVVWFKAHR